MALVVGTRDKQRTKSNTTSRSSIKASNFSEARGGKAAKAKSDPKSEPAEKKANGSKRTAIAATGTPEKKQKTKAAGQRAADAAPAPTKAGRTNGKAATKASAKTAKSNSARAERDDAKRSAASKQNGRGRKETVKASKLSKANSHSRRGSAMSKSNSGAAGVGTKRSGERNISIPATMNQADEAIKSEILLPNGYRPLDNEPFMNERQRIYFRNKLMAWKEDILRQNMETLRGLHDDSSQQADPADRATAETDRALELRARDRQRKLMGKIDAALARIEDGSYGYCEETGEPISLKRLDARPIATLSIEAQERRERRERVFRDD